jgi:hypothetical protein
MDSQIFGEECSRPQIITIGKSARKNEKGIVQQGLGGLEELIDMDKIGVKTCHAAGMSSLTVAINTGGTQHKRTHHL